MKLLKYLNSQLREKLNLEYPSYTLLLMDGVQKNNQNKNYMSPPGATFNIDSLLDPNNVLYWNGSLFSTTNKSSFLKTPFNIGLLLGSNNFLLNLSGKSIMEELKDITKPEETTIGGESIPELKSKLQWGSKNWQQDINLAGSLLADISLTIPTADKTINENDLMTGDIRNTAELTLLKSGNPVAMGIGVTTMAVDKTGGFTDASKGLGGATDTANFIASLGGVGAGYFLNKTIKYNKDQNVEQSSGYLGFKSGDEVTAENNSNAKLLFGSGKANSIIQNAITERNKISDILNTSKLQNTAMAGSADIWNLNRQLKLQGGYNLSTQVAKNGIKFPSKEELDKIIYKKLGGTLETTIKPEKLEGLFKFKKGGSINVIPEGALHARLNNMNNTENITKKGIPVLDINGEQLAEIERNEIIFRKEVTDKLEELARDGSEKAALEAGKLLVTEIFENTDDRTGLIKKAQKGTKLVAPEQFDELKTLSQLIKDYPILNTVKFRIIADPNYTKEKTGVGSIEYLPSLENSVTYSNGYSWTKPELYNNLAVILFNPKESNYEDIKLDVLHVLRDLNPGYGKLLQLLKDNISDDYYHAASERFNLDKLNAVKNKIQFNDNLDHYLNNLVDGFVRNMLFDSADPEELKKHNYAPKEELIKYNKSMIPYIDLIKKYIQGTPIKLENGGKLNNLEKEVLLTLLMEKNND